MLTTIVDLFPLLLALRFDAQLPIDVCVFVFLCLWDHGRLEHYL